PEVTDGGGSILFNGLLIEGRIEILKGKLANCLIHHCTLVSDKGGIEVDEQHDKQIIELCIERSICGPVKVSSLEAQVKSEESIVDYRSDTELAINVPEGLLAIEKSTIFGFVKAKSIEASNCTFADK